MPDIEEIIGAIGGIAICVLLVLLFMTRADLADARTALANRVASEQQAQVVTLKDEAKGANAAVTFTQDTAAIANTATTDLTQKTSAIETRAAQEINHATTEDDGPAAAVLVYAANSLRDTAARIVRSGDGDEIPVSGLGDPGRRAGDTPGASGAGGQWPRTQRDFGQLAIDWGRFGEQCAQQLATARTVKRATAARIAIQKNATATP